DDARLRAVKGCLSGVEVRFREAVGREQYLRAFQIEPGLLQARFSFGAFRPSLLDALAELRLAHPGEHGILRDEIAGLHGTRSPLRTVARTKFFDVAGCLECELPLVDRLGARGISDSSLRLCRRDRLNFHWTRLACFVSLHAGTGCHQAGGRQYAEDRTRPHRAPFPTASSKSAFAVQTAASAC